MYAENWSGGEHAGGGDGGGAAGAVVDTETNDSMKTMSLRTSNGCEDVQIFETSDPARRCMITLEPIHESNVEFCPEVTLNYPNECFNGIRLKCSHEFNASCLIWFWMLNQMLCPCCRGGDNMDARTRVDNFSRVYRRTFTDRQQSIHTQELVDETDDVQNMVESEDMDTNVTLTIVANIQIEFSTQMIVYMYGPGGVIYNTVVPFYRCRNAERVNAENEEEMSFKIQGNDLRLISRYMDSMEITSVRLVLFLYDGLYTSVIMESPMMNTMTCQLPWQHRANESVHEPTDQHSVFVAVAPSTARPSSAPQPIAQQSMAVMTSWIPAFSVVDNMQQLLSNSNVNVSISATPWPLRYRSWAVQPQWSTLTSYFTDTRVTNSSCEVVSVMETENIAFTDMKVKSDLGYGTICLQLEQNKTLQTLDRLSDIKWVVKEVDYSRATLLLRS
jgi:hypothetical protein